jgi:hypothetical protein
MADIECRVVIASVSLASQKDGKTVCQSQSNPSKQQETT